MKNLYFSCVVGKKELWNWIYLQNVEIDWLFRDALSGSPSRIQLFKTYLNWILEIPATLALTTVLGFFFSDVLLWRKLLCK